MSRKGYPSVHSFKWYVLGFCFVFHLFFKLLDVLIVYVTTVTVSYSLTRYREPLFSSLWGLAQFAFHWWNTIIFFTALLSIVHILSLCGSVGVLLLAYWYAMVKRDWRHRISLIFDHNLQKQASWQTILYTAQVLSGGFQYIFIANSIFGNVFGVFILVNTPLSANLMIRLLYGHLRGWLRFQSYIALAYQFTCIWGIHFAIAYSSKFNYSPAHSFTSYAVRRAHKVGNFRARLKFALILEVIHTKKHFGVHYFSIAIISLSAFAKVNKIKKSLK